jgi:uncharacterized protein (DUF302 family)
VATDKKRHDGNRENEPRNWMGVPSHGRIDGGSALVQEEHIMIDVDYAFTRKLAGTGVEEARGRMAAALAEQGFGILTEIDVKQTLKLKLNVDFRKYLILGACNPHLAHRALGADLALGLLLPCNIVIAEDERGNSVVSVADPRAMLRVAGESQALLPLMEEARTRLRKALESA